MLIITSLLVIFAGGLSALFSGKRNVGNLLGCGSTVLGASILFFPVVRVLTSGNAMTFVAPWKIPGGNFSLNLDPLAALFMIPLLIVSISAALFGTAYLTKDKKRNGSTWFTFNILIISMILILLADNGLLFLVVWELMSISSLMLVLYEHEDSKSQKAGWIYITASHAGVAFLFPLFFILAKAGNGFDFSGIGLHSINGSLSSVLFILAIIGFGCKAGFMPLHVWLPEAHPAAPSHVSALMSAVMIKMGIYGILRTLSFLSVPQVSWGITLIIIGVISGVLGILFALCQNDIKRLLAYSSVENIGIIAIGMGIGLIGFSCGNLFIAVIGLSGAFLHIVNHAFFKGLLFLCAGSVVHATGTRDMERMGGLIKKMPFTGAAFLLGAFAICGLPPMNGFLSEFLIYVAGLFGISGIAVFPNIAGLAVVISLAMIGGLAVVAFTKSFGMMFLGEPRVALQHSHYQIPMIMKIAMLILAVACIMVSLCFAFINGILVKPLSTILPVDSRIILSQLNHVNKSIDGILIVSALFSVLVILFIVVRKAILKNRTVSESITWDCGYAQPTARMQYTATSFTEPLVRFFSSILRPRTKLLEPESYLPVHGSFHSEIEDQFMRKIFNPVFSGIAKAFSHLKWFQSGKVHAYVMYIALAAITALIVTFTL